MRVTILTNLHPRFESMGRVPCVDKNTCDHDVEGLVWKMRDDVSDVILIEIVDVLLKSTR